MAAKLPFMKFFPKDWQTDTRLLTAEARGAWIDMLCHLWQQQKRGRWSGTLEEFSRVCGIPFERAIFVADELGRVGDLNLKETDGTVTVTVISRRMLRDEKERELSRIRVMKHRKNKHVTLLKQKSNKEKAGVALQKADTPPPNSSLSHPSKLPTARAKKSGALSPPSAKPQAEKPYLRPDPEKDPMGALICSYKVFRGVSWDDRRWDKIHQPRARKAAKDLIEACGSLDRAFKCLASRRAHYQKENLSWNLNTVVRDAPEWVAHREREDEHAHMGHQGFSAPAAHRRSAQEGQGLRAVGASAQSVLDGIRGLPHAPGPAKGQPEGNRSPDDGSAPK